MGDSTGLGSSRLWLVDDFSERRRRFVLPQEEEGEKENKRRRKEEVARGLAKENGLCALERKGEIKLAARKI
jgi:hypothetical protein